MSYSSKLKDDQVDKLFEAILQLEDQEECYRFFEDLCTINEIKSLAQRLEVAIMLRQKYIIRLQRKLVPVQPLSAELIVLWFYGADGYNRVLDSCWKVRQ